MSKPEYKHYGSVEVRTVEECAELIMAIQKAIRFGWNEYHPDRPESNNALEVMHEITDVRDVLNELEEYLRTLKLTTTHQTIKEE